MKLSACVIVKNEEKNLPKWLDCMGRMVDELVVVDTGSADKSKEIAAKAGAKVYDFVWCDDFSAAKNYAIDQATGDWILFFDADEYFSDESIAAFRRDFVNYHKDKKIGAILCRLINIDTDKGGKIIDTMLQCRIFRNTGKIRYTGAVHEQLANSAANLRMVINSDWKIYHTGYSSSILKEKTQRNLVLLLEKEAKAETQKEKDLLAPYFMDAYNCLGEYEKAIKYARQSLDSNLKLIGKEGHFYEVIFTAMQLGGYSRDEQLALLDEAIEKHPDDSAFVLEKGFVLWLKRDYLGGWQFLERGMEMRREFERRLRKGDLTSDTSLAVLPYAYRAMGDICYKKGDKPQAAEYFLKGLQEYKYSEESLAGLYACIADNDPVEIIELLSSIYDRKKDGEFLVKVLEGKVKGAVIAYYMPKNANGQQDIDAKTYLLVKRYDAAAVEASDEVQSSSNFLLAELVKHEESGSSEEKEQMEKLRPVLGTLLGSRYKPLLSDTSLRTPEGKALRRLLGRKV